MTAGQATLSGADILLRFPYDPERVAAVKALPHPKRWDGLARVWRVAYTSPAVRADLERLGWLDVSTIPTTPPRVAVGQVRALTVGDRQYRLLIHFDYRPDLVVAVRTLAGARWDGRQRRWEAAATAANLTSLGQMGFDLTPAAHEAVRSATAAEQAPAPTAPTAPAVDWTRLPRAGDLYPFQRAGIEAAHRFGGRVLLADEMGLGKTVQALGFLATRPDALPAVAVVPASLKLNWEREARRWLPPGTPVTVLAGSPAPGTRLGPGLTVLNYDIAERWAGVVSAGVRRTLILDEAHYVKNRTAKRTKAVQKIAAGVPYVLALSGTPLVSRPMELYTALGLVRPSLFPSRYQFGMRYCDPRPNRWSGGMDFEGASNSPELFRRLTASCMVRRLKAEVLTDLPPKTRSLVPLELDNTREYAEAEAGVVHDLETDEVQTVAHHLALLTALRRVACRGKLAAAVAWIRDYLEADGKLVVFAVHHETIDRLCADLADYGVVAVDGRTPLPARQEAVDRFQTDPACRAFVGNVRAAGVGLTLTAASSAAFLELPWTPGEVVQAEDRVHRIGQAGSVAVYYLLAAGTVDEPMAALLEAKARVLGQVLDGAAPDATEEALLGQLVAELKRRK